MAKWIAGPSQIHGPIEIAQPREKGNLTQRLTDEDGGKQHVIATVDISDGIVKVGSEPGEALGLAPGKFSGDSYLWRIGQTMIVSNIESKKPGTGAFRELVEKIESFGFKVKVPTPMRQMREILVHMGFRYVGHDDPDVPGPEVWTR